MIRWSPHMRAAATLIVSLAAVVAASCGSSTAASSRVTTTASKAAAVASLSPHQLVHAGQLTVCADEPSPPGVFVNSKNQLVGYDVDLAKAIGKQLGLKTKEVPTVFDTIILAAKTGKCDIVVDTMFIKPSRVKQIDMIPYLRVGQQFILKHGGTQLGNVAKAPTVLCGKTITVINGSAEQDALASYARKCTSAGKPTIKSVVFNDASPALQAVLTGQADALFDDYPIVAYYAKLHANQFELNRGAILNNVPAGIAVPPAKRAVELAVMKALRSLAASGSYHRILADWGAAGLALPHPGTTVSRRHR